MKYVFRSILFVVLFVAAALTAHAQVGYESPRTVVWSSVDNVDGYIVGATDWLGAANSIVEIADVAAPNVSITIDLDALDIFGYPEIFVRCYRLYAQPDGTTETVYSVWRRSSAPGEWNGTPIEPWYLSNAPNPRSPDGIWIEE